ncbi:MAG: hypothetical protein NC918_00785 [Candidatus Omnitrophica bacterium]|nr:hypothetical protein [Candidatus Omnitrophota bacterium]
MGSKLFGLKKLDLSFLKSKNKENQSQLEEKIAQLQQIIDTQKLQIEVLYLIVERYRSIIEESEAKSVAELSLLVKPLDSTITELKIYIQDQFHPYIYQENFIFATEKALDIIFSWKKIKSPISFWLDFEDMAKLKAADDIDMAIFICSLFRALGSDSAKVVIAKDKSAWVFFTFNNKDYIVDIKNKSMSAYPSGGEDIKEFFYSALYVFNDKEYKDLSQS